ncbi:MAG: PepSY domain-containing protein [Deltaproteobacteria bacterium]|nr:PepSY domain-containing protein [Deltaproteobacteria bacterium]
MNRKLYAVHRWISLVALLQLLAWSVSGLFFSAVPRPRVMGRAVAGAHERPLAGVAPSSIAALVEQAKARGVGDVRRIEVRGSRAGDVAIVTGSEGRVRLDAATAEPKPVDADEAKATASADQPSSPAASSVERVERAPPIEYRDKPLPAWRVTLADGAGTVVYVDAVTGDVTARRNDTWRIYDFLWSLHIMAYRDREDFRHPLLIGAAGLATATALSGLVLWVTRVARRRRAK